MAMSAVYTTVCGELLSEARGGAETLYVPDTLGSLVQARSSAGAEVYEAEYWPYGEVQSQSGTNPSPWGFVGLLGYYRDFADLLYVRARHYKAGLMRWMTVDPLWPSQSAYAYAESRPLDRVDPTGLNSITWPSNPPINALPPWLVAALLAFLAELGLVLSEVLLALLLLFLAAYLFIYSCEAAQRMQDKVCSQTRSCRPCDAGNCDLLEQNFLAFMACLAARIAKQVICSFFNILGAVDPNHLGQILGNLNGATNCLQMAAECEWTFNRNLTANETAESQTGDW